MAHMEQVIELFREFLLVPFFVGIVTFFISAYHFVQTLANKDTRYDKTINLIGPFSFLFGLYWNETGLRHRRRFLLYLVLFLCCAWIIIASGAFNSSG